MNYLLSIVINCINFPKLVAFINTVFETLLNTYSRRVTLFQLALEFARMFPKALAFSGSMCVDANGAYKSLARLELRIIIFLLCVSKVVTALFELFKFLCI